MKQFIEQRRNSIIFKSLYSSMIISTLLYIIIRLFSFDFPMTWYDEIILFAKIVGTGSFLMALVAVGCSYLYMTLLRMKRNRRTA